MMSTTPMIPRAFVAILLFLPSACLSVQVGSEQGGAEVDGLVSGYLSAKALKPYDGTILDFAFLKDTEREGELLSFDFWPLGGFGIGVAGARLRVLPFEAALGTFFYHPSPPHYRWGEEQPEDRGTDRSPGQDCEDCEGCPECEGAEATDTDGGPEGESEEGAAEEILTPPRQLQKVKDYRP